MKKGLTKLISWILFPIAIILIVITTAMTLWIHKLAQGLPEDRIIRDFTHDAVTIVYDKNGYTLASFQENKNQIWTPLTDIPKVLQRALIASEDPYFFKHAGIDYRQTWESIKDNLRGWRFVRGGSTITQQVAKNIFLSREKTLTRKIKEYFLAKRIEALLPKERIIEIYLNEAGWGYGIYGVELASRFYLDKHGRDLNIAEAAFLVAMLRNPALYNPYKMMNRVTKRQQLVLMLMSRHNLITKEEYNEALSYTIELRRDKRDKRFTNIGLNRYDNVDNVLPCYARLIEGYLVQTFGRNLLYDVGLDVRTTLDDLIQDKVDDTINEMESGNKRGTTGDIKTGLLLEEGNRIRAIGCTDMWEDAVERIKRLGPPFDLYRYEAKSVKDIAWKNILLIGTKDRLL